MTQRFIPARIQVLQMGRFIDPWVYLTSVALLLVLLAGLVSLFLATPLITETLSVQPAAIVQLQPLTLRPALLGALRINVTANLPANRWVTYEIQLRDQQGQTIASAIKQGWKESGTWSEEGESGTWQQADLVAELDVRAVTAEPVTIALRVLNYGTTSNQDLNEAVSFRVVVQNGMIDSRYLWIGFWVTLVLVGLAAIAHNTTGTNVVDRTIGDSDVTGQGLMGGPRSLVKVVVRVVADETSPRHLTVRLVVKNSQGKQLYVRRSQINLSYQREDGRVESAKGKLALYFHFPSRDAYGFVVEVTPDQPVDQTRLILRDRTRTLLPVEVVQICVD